MADLKETQLTALSPMRTTAGEAAAQPRIAVLVPCYNEAATIADVVSDFARALPEATIWVFDNNSTDTTAAEAQRATTPTTRPLRR
jgi:cellulose synthase/poly-beta-1,6-N-acetylglucosamine synthase-like glycosyltransferase